MQLQLLRASHAQLSPAVVRAAGFIQACSCVQSAHRMRRLHVLRIQQCAAAKACEHLLLLDTSKKRSLKHVSVTFTVLMQMSPRFKCKKISNVAPSFVAQKLMSQKPPWTMKMQQPGFPQAHAHEQALI